MKLKNLPFALLVLFLVLLSLFPRSIEVLNGNPVFGFDNGRDYLAVKSIVVDHKLTLIGEELGAGMAGLSYLFQGPGYFYLLAIPFILFNGNPVGGVLLMLVLGLLSIAFGIYFLYKFFDAKAAIVMGLLLAASPYLTPQSRFFENPFTTTFFILLAFYFTYLLTKNKEKKPSVFIFFAALVSGFIYNLEIGVAIPVCLTLFIYCIFLFKKRFLYALPFLLAGYFISFSPFFIFESRHGFLGLRSFLGYIFIHKQAVRAVHTASSPLWHRAWDLLNVFVYTFTDAFQNKLFFSGYIMIFLFALLVGFVYWKEKDKVKKQFLLFLFLLFPVNFFVFLPLRFAVYEYYLTDLTLAYIFLLSYSLAFLFKQRYMPLSIGIASFLALLLLLSAKSAYFTSISDYKDYGGTAKLKGKIDAIDFIYKDAQNKPFGLLVFTPPVYTYAYDYILWWHGLKTYHYIPYKEKKGTFYLLIEVDGTKPWSYKGWEETVIKTGHVVFTKTLPSGFIVEKRVAQ